MTTPEPIPSRATASQREEGRLAALSRLGALHTEACPDCDRIARLASSMFTTPIAAIVLIDGTRAWCKALIGCDLQETLRQEALSELVLHSDGPVVIHDTLADKGARQARAVTQAPFARFFAGAPLLSEDGERVGCLLVMDTKPRPDFAAGEAALLADLATLPMLLMQRARDLRIETAEAREHALINDILRSMTTADGLSDAIETTVQRVRAATGAMICTLAKLDQTDGLVHFVAADVAPHVGPDFVPELSAGMPILPSLLFMGDTYDADLSTREIHCYAPAPGEAGRYPIRDLMHKMGIVCSTHISLHLGEQRFSLSLNFNEPRADLADVTQLLTRVQQAIRPMLQRKLDDERLALLSAALSVTHDGIVITEAGPIDPPGPRIVLVNEGFTQMTGWPAAEVIGQTPRIMQSPSTDRAELDRVRAALVQRQPVRAELLNRRRDGSEYWVEIEIRPLADASGRIDHWVSVQRDITKRRAREKAESAAAANASRMAEELLTANRIARMGTWRWTPRTKTLEWSPEICRIFDIDPASVKPSLSEFLNLVHPDDQALMRERIAAPLVRGGIIAADFRTLIGNAPVRHCRMEGQPTFDADGQIETVSGFCQDVTERRQVEAMLLQTEKLKSIGQLTGGIAHDFNNLLTVITVNMEIAAELLEPGHPAAELIGPALQAAASGAELTSSLLAFARRQPLNPQPLDINQVLRDFQGLAARSLGERHALRLDLRHDLPQCRVDRAKLENAVLNLAINSRDAMEHGGTITIRTGLAIVSPSQARRIGELQPGPHVTLTMSDTGSGIPLSIQQRVFDPFFTTKGVGQGTGLGLSMVMGFVRQSGGQVTLDSQPGFGTSICLYLPVEQTDR